MGSLVWFSSSVTFRFHVRSEDRQLLLQIYIIIWEQLICNYRVFTFCWVVHWSIETRFWHSQFWFRYVDILVLTIGKATLRPFTKHNFFRICNVSISVLRRYIAWNFWSVLMSISQRTISILVAVRLFTLKEKKRPQGFPIKAFLLRTRSLSDVNQKAELGKFEIFAPHIGQRWDANQRDR